MVAQTTWVALWPECVGLGNKDRQHSDRATWLHKAPGERGAQKESATIKAATQKAKLGSKWGETGTARFFTRTLAVAIAAGTGEVLADLGVAVDHEDTSDPGLSLSEKTESSSQLRLPFPAAEIAVQLAKQGFRSFSTQSARWAAKPSTCSRDACLRLPSRNTCYRSHLASANELR
jgi:hypothetical protein